MKIEVGVYKRQSTELTKNAGHTTGWKIVCEQEKVPHHFTDRPDCPVLVFEGDTPVWLANFLSEGGIAVITGCLPEQLPFEVEGASDASIEYADLGDGQARVQCLATVYPGIGIGKIELHENRIKKLGLSPDEYPAFLYQPYGKGGCWYSGLPLSRILCAQGDMLRRTTPSSDYSERIVSTDKHSVAQAMRNILIRAFHARGLPYVYLWYYPNDYQSAFTFRVDVDGVYGENLKQISEAAKQHDFKLTFFVNKSLCQQDVEQIEKIDRMHEIGNHANVHNLFPDYHSNYHNILACKHWLERLNVAPGPWFAAPRGMWNPSLHQALDDLGYLFTSDFGNCIEGFPFFPYLDGYRSNTLQIPANPFSVERAWVWQAETGAGEVTPGFVKDFWLSTIEENYTRNYPITLYSHPERFGAMAGEIFKTLQEKLRSYRIWKTTLAEFALWWRQRDQIKYTVDYDPTTNQVMVMDIADPQIAVKVVSSQSE